MIKKIIVLNPNHSLWINSAGLLTTWILNVMYEDILSLNVGIENVHSLWKSIEDQLSSITKDQEHLLKDRLVSLKKRLIFQ